ncbi:N-acetylmannosamine-6-phosphate 2-epimerase [Ahrensia sp. 13_GOM-1096m]|uniref:N-acetylmannosamine-6-phosphate 2-epimerase n=1 Tax=Ahrensia sp. 13_GOM-1096m TaxID=1380380 RepID=UPI00047B648C|nr:putative N-acetylmannosamine-6-phosphate 2-epimerase [Ahrensia sp. 13_GOM-1096m]
MNILENLNRGLVVSCQPVDGGPMDRPDIIASMARAAVAGGASGLRIEGVENLKAVRPHVSVPIIAIVKRDLPDTAVRITPTLRDVEGLVAAGADIIAYDATDRSRPDSRTDIINAINAAGVIGMADCSTFADAQTALAEGALLIGTTLAGYTEETSDGSTEPNLDLVRAFSKLGGFIMAEGRYNTPEFARAAIEAGADCITVGSALTRLEHATSWFKQAVDGAAKHEAR